MSKIYDLVMSLVGNCIDVTIKNTPTGYVYDLNTFSKSHVWLREKDGKIVAEGRYSIYCDNIESKWDVYSAVCDSMEGRDFISSQWKSLLREEDYITIENETIERVRFR